MVTPKLLPELTKSKGNLIGKFESPAKRKQSESPGSSFRAGTKPTVAKKKRY